MSAGNAMFMIMWEEIVILSLNQYLYLDDSSHTNTLEAALTTAQVRCPGNVEFGSGMTGCGRFHPMLSDKQTLQFRKLFSRDLDTADYRYQMKLQYPSKFQESPTFLEFSSINRFGQPIFFYFERQRHQEFSALCSGAKLLPRKLMRQPPLRALRKTAFSAAPTRWLMKSHHQS